MENPFDRNAESLGNVTFLEHLNVEIPKDGVAAPVEIQAGAQTLNDGRCLNPGRRNMIGRQSTAARFLAEPDGHRCRQAAGRCGG